MHTIEQNKSKNSFLVFAERYADKVNNIQDKNLRVGILRVAYDFRIANLQWQEAVLSRADSYGPSKFLRIQRTKLRREVERLLWITP